MKIVKADYIFNDIYKALIVNHDLNKEFLVDCKMLGHKTILRLEKILKKEHIEYRKDNDMIICWLNDRSFKIAQSVYTEETKQKLLEEEKLLNEKFINIG